MDATTPPPGDDEPTPPQPSSPPPLIEPAAQRRAGASTAAGPSAAPDRDPVPQPTGPAEPSDAPREPAPAAPPALIGGPEDPTVPDTAVEATLASEPAGIRPEEPVVPTASADEVRVAPQPENPQPENSEPSSPTTGSLQREVVYVPAPAPPKELGNRGIGVLIAAVSAFVFLFVYALVSLLIRAVMSGDTRIEFLADVSFYIPVLLFTVAFVLLALIVNRAGWWSFVLGSLFVGAFVYFGTIGVLLLNQAATLTPAAAEDQFRQYLINPLVIAAGLVAREVALWVGAGISARGRRVKARNAEARELFDREQAERRSEIERNGAVVRGA